VERAVAVRVDGLTRGTARVRSVVARGTARHRSAWHRSVAPGYGKGKFDAQILWVGGSIFGEKLGDYFGRKWVD
jgi:hypothetical protein